MLDLQAGVHFQKIKSVRLVEQKLDRASPHIIDRLRRLDRRRAHLLAQFWRHDRTGRFLDHLLVPPLYRAVALAEMDSVALAVGKNLYLDMARLDDGFFQNQLAIAKGVFRFRPRQLDRVGDIAEIMDQPHAAATAASGGLDHQRHADFLRFGDQHIVGLVIALIARHTGHPGCDHRAFRTRLVAHHVDRLLRRADEDDAGIGAGLGEGGVFREEAIARMDRVGASVFRCLDDRIDQQIGFIDRCGSDADGVVGHLDMRRAGIGVGIDRDGAHAQGLGRAHHPAGDLAAIGNQERVDSCHANFPSTRSCRACRSMAYSQLSFDRLRTNGRVSEYSFIRASPPSWACAFRRSWRRLPWPRR